MTFDLMLFPNFKDKAFTMSYDDGYRQDIRLIKIMQKYGLKGTFNLNSGLMQNENKVKAEEVCDVYLKTGNEVAVHGVKHFSLTAISEDRIIEEIFNDRRELERITGALVKGMAYANGKYNDTVVGVLKKCGIAYARTTKNTRSFMIDDDWLRMPTTCHHNDESLFTLLEQFISQEKKGYFWANQPKLFYLWGHSYEFDNDKNWDRIEKFAEKIGKRENVWYATNGEIVRYVEAYKALQYSADGTVVYNPSATDVCIRTIENKGMMIPSGKIVKMG